MVKGIILVAATLMAGQAMATWQPADESVNADADAYSRSDAYSKAESRSDSHAAGFGVGLGMGEGGDAKAKATGGEGGKATGGDATGGKAKATGGTSSANSESGPSNAANGDQISTNINNYDEVFRAPFMDSQTLLMNSAGCKTFLGVQFSGANNDGAAATGLGIPLDDEDCKLDKAARLAFASGNLKLGWQLFCWQPQVNKAGRHHLKLEGVKGRKVRELQAHTNCMEGAMDKAARLAMINAELTELRATLIEVQALPGYDDSAIRARLHDLETLAHGPRTYELPLKDRH